LPQVFNKILSSKLNIRSVITLIYTVNIHDVRCDAIMDVITDEEALNN